MHLASVIPRPYPLDRAAPRLVWFCYGAGLGLGTVTAATYLAEMLGRDPFPWSERQVRGPAVHVGCRSGRSACRLF